MILDEAIAYKAESETADPTGAVQKFKNDGADIITFTSSSTVEGFFDLGLSSPDETMIASIGPVTSSTLAENGYEVDAEANPHNVPALVQAVLELANEEPFGEEDDEFLIDEEY